MKDVWMIKFLPLYNDSNQNIKSDFCEGQDSAAWIVDKPLWPSSVVMRLAICVLARRGEQKGPINTRIYLFSRSLEASQS